MSSMRRTCIGSAPEFHLRTRPEAGGRSTFPALPGLIALLVMLCLNPGEELRAQGDGPRAHGAAPVDVNVLNFQALALLDANRIVDPSLIVPLSRFDTQMGVVQYIRSMELQGRFFALMGIVKGGRTRRVSSDTQFSVSSSGAADPFAGVMFNIAGLPPMSVGEFRDFTPGTVINLLLGANVPIGEYDADRVINLGSNRWAYRIAMPVVRSFQGGAGGGTTLELIPNIQLFGRNHDRNLSQEPLLSIEGHVTHDLSPRLWGSLGFLYSYGGKTTVNGIQQSDTQRSLSLTGVVGYEISPRTALYFQYGETVEHNASGLDGSLYRVKLVRRF